MKCRKCGQEIYSRSDSLFTGKTLLIWLGVLVPALATLIVVGIMVIPTLLNQSADDSNKLEATEASETEYTDSSTVTDPSVATEPKICRL